MRKATKKASVPAPAPNIWAYTMSRTKPVTRDSEVMPLTMPVDLRRALLMGMRSCAVRFGRRG